MSDRVVKVTLRAEINNYLSGMEQARRKTQETGDEASKTAAKLEQQRQAFNLIGGGLVAVGTLAAAAVGIAIKKFADFDQAMSAVAAATHETSANMSLLRDAALDAGARTVFSATEAANAIEELGKAGLSTKDILNGGLDGALNLAAAGGLDVADAAGIAATALQLFHLNGTQAAHVSDLLAAGAGKAMGDVTDLSQALAQGGQVAAATGLSIEETTAALAAFASQGLLGADAGTSFKSMLQRLTPQSAEAKAKMDELGISAYDASGNFVGLQKFAGNLQSSLKGLTTEQRNSALATIFGSDAVRAANVLYSEGAKGIGDWEKKVDDSGYAAETARLRLDNLNGDLEQFGGALDTAAIKAGQAADGPLRFLTETATDMVTAFANLPTPIQQGALAVGAVTAAVTLASGAFLLGVPKVAEYRAALETLGPTAQRTSRLVAGIFRGLTAAGAIAAAMSLIDEFSKKMAEGVVPSAEQTTNALTKATTATEAFKAGLAARGGDFVSGPETVRKQVEGLNAALQDSADHWRNFSHGISGPNEEILATVGILSKEYGNLAKTDLPQAQEKFKALVDATDGSERSQWRLLSVMPELKDALTAQATELGLTADKQTLLKLAMGETAPAAEDNSKALAELSGAAQTTAGDVDKLADTIRGFGSAELDTREAARNFQDALASLDESVKNNGNSLDITTEAGRQNEAALDNIAQAALESAAAIQTQTGSEDLSRAAVLQGRDALIQKLGAFGITGQAAEDYADKLGLIPKNVDTAVNLTGVETARARLDSLIDGYNNRSVTLRAVMAGADALTKRDGGIVDYYGRGGIRENHVAQIAPAGSWRVWAEPETGGEAYIPFAPSKRARSLDVWAETGSRLGVAGFAAGAVVPPVYAGSGVGGKGKSTVDARSYPLNVQVVPTPGRSMLEQVNELRRGRR